MVVSIKKERTRFHMVENGSFLIETINPYLTVSGGQSRLLGSVNNSGADSGINSRTNGSIDFGVNCGSDSDFL